MVANINHCLKCGDPIRSGEKYHYCRKPECQRIKALERGRKFYGTEPRRCRSCGDDMGYCLRHWCDKPECQEHKRHYINTYNGLRKSASELGTRKVRPTKKRVCAADWGHRKKCLHYIDNNNRLRCSYCQGLNVVLSAAINEEWAELGW